MLAQNGMSISKTELNYTPRKDKKTAQSAGMKITRKEMTNLMQKVKPKPRFYLEPMRSLFNGGWLQEDDIKNK